MQKKWYSGKKKRHTIKAQVIVNKATKQIICIAEDSGKTHDFALYKNTIGSHVLESIKEQADSGYQGLAKFHQNSETPKKKPKGGELTDDEKNENAHSESDISKDESPVKVLMIPTNEEIVIIEDVKAILNGTYHNHDFKYSFEVKNES